MFAFKAIMRHFDYLHLSFKALKYFINYICENFIQTIYMGSIKEIFKKNFLLLKSIYKRYHFSRIAFAVILVFILIIDQNSLINNLRYIYKIQGLERQISHYQNLIDDSKNRLIELNSDQENLEKFAREQFLMKKDNEDIFIVDSED